jgi:hypothetical protein
MAARLESPQRLQSTFARLKGCDDATAGDREDQFLSDRAIGHGEVCRFVLMEPRGDEKPHSLTAGDKCRHFADIFASSRSPNALYFRSS